MISIMEQPYAGADAAGRGEAVPTVRKPTPVWGRVYPGRRWWFQAPCREFDSAGRHKAGPTGKKPALFHRKEAGTAVRCGAGFTPADGGGVEHRAGESTPLAGIKPAPQVKKTGTISQEGSRHRRSLWGRVYPGRRGRGPSTVAGARPS